MAILPPCVLLFMLKLTNRHDLIGAYANSRAANAIASAAAS
jgi:hypothetical protein